MAFYDSFDKHPGRTAFLDDRNQVITYEDLDRYARTMGEYLKPRSLAFCLCENSCGSPAGYLSLLFNRVVPLLLDKKIDPALLDNLLKTYQPNYLYYPQELKDHFPDYRVLHEAYGYVLSEIPGSPQTDLNEDLGLLLTTSGSTGSPKLVRQTYANIQSNAEAIAAFLALDASERPVTTLPMNYTYGLSVINSHIQAGATVLMTDKTMIMKQFWDFMKEQHATSFAGVPFTYEMLKRMKFFKMDLPDLRYISQSGGKLSPDMHREFAQWCRDNGKSYIAMYGATEATARMAYLPSEMSVEKYGSVGKAIPGSRFALIDVDGSEIHEPNREGELFFYGPGVTMGYAQCRADLSKGDEWHGKLETGDIAICDEDGFYYIVGRKKRFLKIFGNRVNLDEIDRLVKGRFEGIDCASTGVDDRMKTFITDESLVDQVRQYLSNTTHLSESAFDVRYIKEIPKNASGKTLFKELPD